MTVDASHIRALLGNQPLLIVDVGAAFGLPAHIKVLEEVADALLFEPDPEEACRLQDWYRSRNLGGNIRVFPVALSGTGGTRTLFVTNAPTGSSLLHPKPDMVARGGDPVYFYPMREVTVETSTLESVLRESKVSIVDAIKLDVQGAEYEILHGLGDEHCRRLLAVELEIGMPGMYEDQPGFSELDPFLRKNGLELFDLKPARGHRAVNGDYRHYPVKLFGVNPDSPTLSKRIWEVDAVYFRKPEYLWDTGDGAAIQRLATLYCVYGFFIEAVHLIEASGQKGVLAAGEVLRLIQAVVDWHRKRQYSIVYAPNLYSRLRRIKHILLRLMCGRRDARWLEP
ncbi:MAG: FkbM family methyltransferase [Nitrospira sp.]|nr:FkbM family methyltransferase [Nitrospira sp.]